MMSPFSFAHASHRARDVSVRFGRRVQARRERFRYSEVVCSRWLGLFCVLLVACGAGRAAPREAKAQARDGGFDIDAYEAREIPALPQRAVTVGAVTGMVESASAPTTHPPTESSTQVDIPIGTASPLSCFVFSSAIDAGGQLAQTMRVVSKLVDVKMVLPRDIVAIGEHPLVLIDAAYTVKSAPTQGGIVKAAVYDHPTTPLLCLHDEMGYHAAFKRIVSAFAASLKRSDVETKPSRYADLEIEKQDTHPMGFTHADLTDDEDGTRIYRSTSTTFTLRSPVELDATDTVRTEVWARDGTVSSMSYVEAENGDLSENMTLRHTSGNEYTYEGMHAGKKITGTLKTKGPSGFVSDERTCAGVKKLFTDGGELHVDVYHPDVDPTAPLEEVFRPASRAERTVTIEFGKFHATSKVDAEGRMVSATMTLGEATMTYERVYVRGSF
jgi:hypothetical protein